MIDRRRLIATPILAATLLAAPRIARAAWPDRPIRLIVPFAAGGNPDVLGRLFAEPLGREIGQPFVVENRVGAASNIGTEAAVRAAPDGQTILLGSIANAINQTLYKNISYVFPRDLAPIAPLYSIPNVLTATPDLPFRGIAGLIAYARANPGRLNYGSSGSGTTPHLTGVLFAKAAGIELTHVVYRASASAQQDLMAGRIQLMFENLPVALPLLREGRTRGLAVTLPRRAAQLPDVPSFAEAGFPLELLVWGGLFAPSGTPVEILDRLNAAVAKVAAADPLASRLADLGSFPVNGDRAAFTAFVAAETIRWGEVVRASGAEVE
jgi:tripartite-type tricarboxylate transporter receptor subunit TctC